MRAGTQTLIQALQALPLVDDHDADDDIHHDATPTEPDSDEDDSHGTYYALCPPAARRLMFHDKLK